MRSGFKLLEHTADVGIHGWGATRAECLQATCMGLQHIMTGESPLADGDLHETATISAPDWDSLAVRTLGELLWWQEDLHAVPSSLKLAAGDGCSVDMEATLSVLQDSSGVEVKAITYHELAWWQEGDIWNLRVYVDL